MLCLRVWQLTHGRMRVYCTLLLVALSVYRSVCGSGAVGVCLQPSSTLQAALLKQWCQLPGWTFERLRHVATRTRNRRWLAIAGGDCFSGGCRVCRDYAMQRCTCVTLLAELRLHLSCLACCYSRKWAFVWLGLVLGALDSCACTATCNAAHYAATAAYAGVHAPCAGLLLAGSPLVACEPLQCCLLHAETACTQLLLLGHWLRLLPWCFVQLCDCGSLFVGRAWRAVWVCAGMYLWLRLWMLYSA
jgi:hypothetical protein